MIDEQPAPPDLALPDALRRDLEEADALAEIVVLYDPAPEVLEAYGLEEQLGVVAVVSAAAARARALEAGALEALDPALPEDEARARLRTAVARFRSRLELERTRDDLDAHVVRVERDLRLAARLQRSLLPRDVPDVPGVLVATAYLPREFVSGDSYELRRVGTGQLALYTLDAVGHDVRAALLTVLLRAALAPEGPGGAPRPPHEVISDLNAALLEAKLEESPTAAACYALLDAEAGVLRVANAGHPRPIRIGADGVADRLGASGLLLGIDPETYHTAEVRLTPGDRVYLFTDGADPGYDDAFLEQLVRHGDLDLEDQVGGALGAVIDLDEEGRPEDDVTVVALQWLGRA